MKLGQAVKDAFTFTDKVDIQSAFESVFGNAVAEDQVSVYVPMKIEGKDVSEMMKRLSDTMAKLFETCEVSEVTLNTAKQVKENKQVSTKLFLTPCYKLTSTISKREIPHIQSLYNELELVRNWYNLEISLVMFNNSIYAVK